MKTELGNLELVELSNTELESINGGGPTFRWLGEVFGFVVNSINYINDIPGSCVLGVASTYVSYQNLAEIALTR